MTKLIEFDYYLDPLGTEFNLHDAKVMFIMSGTGRGMAPIEYITERGPLQHGESLLDFRLRPRLITMVTRRRFLDRQGYWDGRNDLLDALRPNRQVIGQFNAGRLRKIMPDGSVRDIDVMIESGPMFEPSSMDRWDERAFTEVLRFVAHDPTFYNPTQQAQQWVVTIEDNLIFGCRPDVGIQQVYDTFTDINGTHLFVHVPDVDVVGGGWNVYVGTCDIQGNQARWSIADVNATAAIDSGIADGIVEADVMTGVADGHGGIAFRASAWNVWWAFVLKDNLQRAELLLRNGGAVTTEAWVPFVQDENRFYNLKVAFAGGRILCYIDDVLYIDHYDTTLQANTRHGLYAHSNVNARFDNFDVRRGWPCHDPHPDRLVFPIWFSFDLISSYLGVTYGGTWAAFPTIEITGPGANPRIENLTTGEQLALDYDIAAGEIVTFTTEYGNKKVTNQVGDNLLPYLTTDSDLATFHLEPYPGAPNGVNQMHVLMAGANNASAITLMFYTRYIGI